MIFKQEWRSYIKTLLIWGACVAGFDFLMILMFPGLEETLSGMSSMYQSMGAFGTAFGMDKMNIGTAIGFYGTYVGTILSVGGAMFAALLGTSVLAKEEAGHTAEYLYTLPYSRVNIVVKKILAVVSIILVFELVNVVAGTLAMALIGGEYERKDLLLFHIGQSMMHLEIASVGILISACTKRVNAGIGLGIALLLYFLDMMSRVLDQLSFCRYITPFYYANAADVITNGTIDGGLLLVGAGVMAVCLLGGTWIYKERDLAA